MRYEHFLPAARPSPWPSAVLCVSASALWGAGGMGGAREYATLDSWHVQLCTRHGDGYAVAREASGATAEGFWKLVHEASCRTPRLLIISTEFRAAASVLGLWERMESGYVQIAGSDSRPLQRAGSEVHPVQRDGDDASEALPPEVGGSPLPKLSRVLSQSEGQKQPKRGKRERKSGGICILEDPPIVIEMRVGIGGAKVTWVDAANYGVNLSGASTAARSASTELSAWFIRAASTLHILGPCGWKNTAGSQAMHLFRAQYHETPTLSHTNRDATALESRAIFGGRCECFRLGRIDGNAHLYDIRSMYPYLCATILVPVRLVDARSVRTVVGLVEAVRHHFCIADVAIETDEPEYPYNDGKTVVYPTGRYNTTLCGAELDHALSNGRVRSVRCVALYEAEFALKRYAEALYEARCAADKQGDMALSVWIKRLLVSLPGKFAQRVAAWEDIPGAECPWEWAEWYQLGKSGAPERWRSIAGRIQREAKGGFSDGAVPAITAAICAAGRERLMRVMRCAGVENVYYCDTDSVIVSDYGVENLTLAGWVRPGEWGYLQHVESSADCEIYGVKRYRIGNRVREAGVSAGQSGGIGHGTGGGNQPWIGWSLRKQQSPADWRESHPVQRGPGMYDSRRESGGSVKTPEVMEW